MTEHEVNDVLKRGRLQQKKSRAASRVANGVALRKLLQPLPWWRLLARRRRNRRPKHPCADCVPGQPCAYMTARMTDPKWLASGALTYNGQSLNLPESP